MIVGTYATRACSWFIKVRLAGFIVLFWISCSSFCEAFPIEQFKNFINNKPTIENFSFELSTTKFKVSGLDPSIFRHFTLTMQNEQIYRLTEDKSGYFMKLNFPRKEFTNGVVRVLPYVPQQEASWARYENQFWTTFNIKDVITTTIERSNAIPAFGPARESEAMINIAYDALNLGIMDLRTIGVTWSNLNFICLSNSIGYKVSGYLELDDSGVPKDALYTLSSESGSYRYRASYYFTTSEELPDYIPSRVTISFLRGSSSVVMSDYKIQKLITGSRSLSVHDIALVGTTNVDVALFRNNLFSDNNTKEYIYTNKTFYQIKTNGWVRLGTSTEIERPALRRKRVVIVALILVFITPLLLLLFRTYRNVNKKQ